MNHPSSTFNHPIENWVFATSALRVAAGNYLATDIGKIARQTDNTTYWRLTGTTPTWEQFEAIVNFSTAAQTPTAATRTYIIGSAISVGKLAVGAVFRWRFNMTKTAAGVAASTIDIAFGTAGTTADTARVSFTKPAGVAAIDEALVEIECIIRSINVSTGVAVGELTMVVNNTGGAGGHLANLKWNLVLNTVSANFDTVAPTFVGLCITTGAADAITIQQVTANATGLA